MQAEPVETAIPSRSSACAAEAPSTPRAMTDRMCGRRSVGCPVSSTPSTVEERGRRAGRGGLRTRGTVISRSAPDELERAGHADGARHVLRAGAPVALLRPAVLLGEDVGPAPDPQRADPLRPLGLVRRERPRGPPRARRRRGRPTARPARRRRGGSTPRWARTTSTTSSIGWSVPTSLFASITDTSVVRSVIARSTSAGSTRP